MCACARLHRNSARCMQCRPLQQQRAQPCAAGTGHHKITCCTAACCLQPRQPPTTQGSSLPYARHTGQASMRSMAEIGRCIPAGFEPTQALQRAAAAAASTSSAAPGPVCAVCGASSGSGKRGRLLQCFRCAHAFYCSKECQKKDWGGAQEGLQAGVVGVVLVVLVPCLLCWQVSSTAGRCTTRGAASRWEA